MFNALSKKLGKKGFTLIELIVVIAIIAILAVILIPRFTGFTDSANRKAAMSDARNILLAVQALQSQDVAVTKDEIVKFGVSYKGVLTLTKVGRDADSNYECEFTFTSDKGFVVHVEDYKLPADTAITVTTIPSPLD